MEKYGSLPYSNMEPSGSNGNLCQDIFCRCARNLRRCWKKYCKYGRIYTVVILLIGLFACFVFNAKALNDTSLDETYKICEGSKIWIYLMYSNVTLMYYGICIYHLFTSDNRDKYICSSLALILGGVIWFVLGIIMENLVSCNELLKNTSVYTMSQVAIFGSGGMMVLGILCVFYLFCENSFE